MLTHLTMKFFHSRLILLEDERFWSKFERKQLCISITFQSAPADVCIGSTEVLRQTAFLHSIQCERGYLKLWASSTLDRLSHVHDDGSIQKKTKRLIGWITYWTSLSLFCACFRLWFSIRFSLIKSKSLFSNRTNDWVSEQLLGDG